MTRTLETPETKVCRDCGNKIEYLADFPGPRCLACHSRKVDSDPLQRPDFIGAINFRRLNRNRR